MRIYVVLALFGCTHNALEPDFVDSDIHSDSAPEALDALTGDSVSDGAHLGPDQATHRAGGSRDVAALDAGDAVGSFVVSDKAVGWPMPFLLIILIIVALVFGPGLWVRRVLSRYSQPDDRYSMTGSELARQLLDEHDLHHVGVELSEDDDHYDPTTKTVRLAADKFDAGSLTAITVAAHEVGHALQDKDAYRPLRLRSVLVRFAMPIERLGAMVLMLGPIVGLVTRVPKAGAIMFIAGFFTLATSTVIHFITLPTEFDASFSRALPLLKERQILKEYDRRHARRILTAAALTYVSASLMSLLNIARWWAIVRR